MTDSTRQAIEIARDYKWGRRFVDAREHGDRFATALVELAGSRPNKIDQRRVDLGMYARAGGDATCSCGDIYYVHPRVPGLEWLTRACDGRLLKL